MPVPASVLEILETNNIAYQLRASQVSLARMRELQVKQAHAACAVKALLLHDSQGQVQLLVPAHHLIDLAAIQNNFGRQLKALPPDEAEGLLKEHSLTSIPAIPQWQGLPTLVDASLLNYPTLWLDTGDAEQTLEIQQMDFRSFVKAAVVGELAHLAPSVPETTSLDKKQILISLNNFTQLRIKQRIEDTLELPPLPETAQRIVQLRANPDSDISDLTNIIELDPSLAAQVVSWASSPYYSAPGKIKSVHDAIVRVLGFDMVMNLALGLSLSKSLRSAVLSPLEIRRYWHQAVTMAAAVEALVTSIDREHRPGFGLAYLSGLLSNFGYMIMAEVFPPHFANLTRHYDVNPHISPGAVEQYLLGVSSCQISSWLMENWCMPEEVIVALRFQNNPDYSGPHAVYPKLLYIAQQLLNQAKLGPFNAQPIPDHLFTEIKLERHNAELTIRNIYESADSLESIVERIQG